METLDKSLIRYTFNGTVHHPLVVATLTTDASVINRTYRHKVVAVARAKANRDWGLFVLLHAKPYRLDALVVATKHGLKDKPSEFWDLVGLVWLGTENARQHPIIWRRLWSEAVEGRRACMSEEDLRIFDNLPEKIEVWRGTSHKRGVAGLSWTLDREKAVWFAQRFCTESRVPLLAAGMVEKRDVLAYFGERGEREIISMKVATVSVTQLNQSQH